MSQFEMPRLSDLVRIIQEEIDQPANEGGQLSWSNPASFVIQANMAVREVFQSISQSEGKWDHRTTTISVAAGTKTVLLPADLRALRFIERINAAGEKVGDIYTGDLSRRWPRAWTAIFYPRSRDTANYQPRLEFNTATTSAFTMRVEYHYAPLELVYGVAQGGSSVETQLGDHETTETGRLVGQKVYFFDGPGAGQEVTALTSDGPTRTITHAAVATAAVAGQTSYDSRPDLPLDALPALIAEMCVRLFRKVDDAKIRNWQLAQANCYARMRHMAGTADRQRPEHIRDDMAELLGTGADPVRGHYWY